MASLIEVRDMLALQGVCRRHNSALTCMLRAAGRGHAESSGSHGESRAHNGRRGRLFVRQLQSCPEGKACLQEWWALR